MIRAVAFVGLATLGIAPSLAQSSPTILAARAAGQVGERYDGYLGVAAAASPALMQEVRAINITRRALYTRLARQKSVLPDEVGITAGCELLGRVGIGEVYLLQDAPWRRRLAGESAPRPAYCGG